jgi:hypothetical protein
MAPTPLTTAATEGLRRILDGDASPERLNAALRHLAKWRAALLDNTLTARNGDTVLSGPFQGMAYPIRAAEGARAARLLGAYEASLEPVIEEIITRAPPVILDIGCAEGYYAVGLARRLPQSRILARDTSEQAQTLCRALAQANSVQDRVEIGGLWTHADFALCETTKTTVICDIEGAEAELLDPTAAPALTQADILVEVHEGMRPDRLPPSPPASSPPTASPGSTAPCAPTGCPIGPRRCRTSTACFSCGNGGPAPPPGSGWSADDRRPAKARKRRHLVCPRRL